MTAEKVTWDLTFSFVFVELSSNYLSLFSFVLERGEGKVGKKCDNDFKPLE